MFLPTLLATMTTSGFADDGGGDWWWVPRLLFLALWITVAIFVVRWLVWGRGRYRDEPSPIERARGILAERYARGEIDEAEFRQRSTALEQ